MVHFQIFLRLGPDGTHVKKCMRPDQMGPNVKFMVPPASLNSSHSYKLGITAHDHIFILLSPVTVSDLQASNQSPASLRSVPGFKQCSFSLYSSDVVSVFCSLTGLQLPLLCLHNL
ncbi:hypothetical protein BDDG_11958 [Blastomyces dermatitidis ATCC 18188]|uniref:Uncharacterized protein n=1 Tax=Ajellomyces dermatitidis (strain ATCC 18188 / CBS 674.68) TaxID=653446 RepID=A0A0J9ELH5_AJEDA|nr:hypothetical protein BDDG_11958 [Blastomyces dermatitidis ATCC 18188]